MSTRKTTLFYAVLIAVASLAIGMVIASRLDLSPASTAATLAPPEVNRAPIGGPVDASTFRNIAKAATPIVVNISTESKTRSRELSDFFGGGDDFFPFFGPSPRGRSQRPNITEGAGTGFVIDKAGLILTNNHVIEGATKIQVGFSSNSNDRLYAAKVVGRDPLTDSALLEITEKTEFDLQAAKFGDSDQMAPGDWVMAIGNPFNLGHTVTVGVVSAIGRPFFPIPGREQPMIQTDAAINPGNSGGPLLNVRGEVIGVNTAIISDRGQAGNLGIGFAVPINAVVELLPQLRQGKVTRGRIGVSLDRTVNSEALQQLGAKGGKGALVSNVESSGPADRAGLKPGDIIVEYNGQPVSGNDDLVNRVVRTAPGASVPIKVLRRGEEQSLSVTVAELDLAREGDRTGEAEEDASAGFGLTLQDLTPDIARQLRVPSGTSGAVVTEVEPRSPAARVGVTRGDVVLEVNRKPVNGASEASREFQRVKSGEIATMLVLRSGQEVFVTMRKE
jgi:serine protease Do